MTEMKIEYAVGITLGKDQSSQWEVPVVRLAAVDQVIAEAVWAMEQFITTLECLALVTLETKAERDAHFSTSELYQRAQAFLASDLVAQWRKRQEEEGEK